MGKLTGRPLEVAAAIFLVLAVLELGFVHLLEPLENRLADAFVRAQAAPLASDPDIVIVDIDEKSLARMQEIAGSWPWPRAIHGELVAGLASQQPKAIVFDILFSEPDRFRPESDAAFNAALEGLANVYFPLVRLPESGDANGVPLAQVAAPLGFVRGARARDDATAALLAPQAIDPKHWRLGIINFLEDRDGVGRRYYVRLDAYGWQLPSLPARVAADLGYPVPDEASITLAWRGSARSFKHVSYSDLIEDFSLRNRKRPADEFRDKIVLIGTAATGLQDLRVTPIASLHSGVEIIATALDNLKNGRRMQRVAAIVPVAAAVVLVALLFAGFRRRWNALKLGVSLAVASLVLLWASYSAVLALWLVPVLVPLAFAWAFYFAGALVEYLREKRTREQAVRMFSRFLNPNVVRDLVEQGQTVESLSGKVKDITVLFSDIRGFTTLSETHAPQEIVGLLNRYFSRQVEVVFRHGGTLDKFIGDAIMAFWGAPIENPNHARHAVAAALEMIRVLQDFKRELAAQGNDMAGAFDVGIGIHSGRAVVGFIGAEQKLDYTAIGDTVNLASRIEGLTKGVARLLVSRDTVEACGNTFDFAARGSYKVKGRTQEVELFEPLSEATAAPTARSA